jgi:hypothetical protein
MKHRAWPAIFFALILLALLALPGGCGDDDDDDDNGGGDVWEPEPGTTWQWQLSDALDLSFDVEMYDVDLYEVNAGTVATLQADGRVVICYFSAGSFEDWRPDVDDFPAEAIGDPLEDWEGEWWIDVRDQGVRDVMAARLDRAVGLGCDGVEPDNVDGYTNDTGLSFGAADQLDYNRWLADQAHARGLSVGLKNDTDQLDDLVDWFDWSLNEECHVYDECEPYETFIEDGKAVFNAEYVDDWADAEDLAEEICGDWPEFSTIIKEWHLTARVVACD